MQELPLNSAAPWGNWDQEERGQGYLQTPGVKVVLRVEVLSDRFRLTSPNSSNLYHEFYFRATTRDVFSTNEVWIEDYYGATQKIVVGKVCLKDQSNIVSLITSQCCAEPWSLSASIIIVLSKLLYK